MGEANNSPQLVQDTHGATSQVEEHDTFRVLGPSSQELSGELVTHSSEHTYILVSYFSFAMFM